MPVDVYEILEQFRQEATSNRDLGDKFERLVASYFATDPIYADHYDQVWLWSEWPLRWGADTGIDIVARERQTSDYCAIQCKFNLPTHTLQKADIDSFFTASGKKFAAPPKDFQRFSSRLIVSTTDKWSKHAEEACIDQSPPVTRLRIRDLANSPVDWSHFDINRPAALSLRPKKQLMPHQKRALEEVATGFAAHDRGKLIMACGTGKTFTSLKISEVFVGSTGVALFLVPSISLLSQALREWTAESETPFHALAVCSDTKIGRHHEDMSVHDLAIPATTKAGRLFEAYESRKTDGKMIVVFSTYQSIDVISQAHKLGFPEFDLTVCDEAHRTTGVTLQGDDESHFIKVHSEEFIQSKRRLYMTATPRIFADATKNKAKEGEATLSSMDDETLYGPIFHRLGFGEAVGKGLLSDYKVVVLAVDEQQVSKALQNSLADANNDLNLEDAVKIVGCWNGLAKCILADKAKNEDAKPMQRAVAFARSIKDSKRLAQMFQQVVNEYTKDHTADQSDLLCEVAHVDGTFNVLVRNQHLEWLKSPIPSNVCRILSNARCLAEGVDVPALDAVLFLNPRDSVVDVVQSVGRVMRRSDDKKYGYVILPISIPAGMAPDKALKDNQRYEVVWQVLQALRAHDDRFNAVVNQIDLNKQRPDKIQVIGIGGGGDREYGTSKELTFTFLDLDIWRDAIYAKIVLKCGDRRYWEDWAKDVAKIAERHVSRISALVSEGSAAKEAFARFLSGLRENINPSIDDGEGIEMLSQHLITRPIFDALFETYRFTRSNPVSLAMQEILNILESQSIEKEVEALQGFYESVRQRVKGIDNATGRQKVIVELYDKFFKRAFPRLAERMGIVYTPVELVDFIIQSAESALRASFNASMTDRLVHILDPFTGTGTFVSRLLQSGLIQKDDLMRKYRDEIHANEIVLLAYYIAAVNIEETYHGLIGGDYQPFDGIVLTDTFQMGEENKSLKFGDAMFPENNKRVGDQERRDIRVIIGNPPYSVGQGSANDNNPNVQYEMLDKRIEETYSAASAANLKKSNYDSYSRAIRWASDRIKDQGVIGFVTNGSFIDANNLDGMRKTLANEFSAVYCFNLRGNQRTSGELSRQEGGKIFGSGSRTPVAITILVKNPANSGCVINYHDIGEYLSRDDKLKIIEEFKSIDNVPWVVIDPNERGDWINQRSPEFDKFLRMGDRGGGQQALFAVYSLGVSTNRDAWVYNFDEASLAGAVDRLITFYNAEVDRYQESCNSKPKSEWPNITSFLNCDPKLISWSDGLKSEAKRGHKYTLDCDRIVTSMYRPFTKMHLYFDRRLNERVLQMPRLFPTPQHHNIVLSVTGIGASKPFSALATDVVPNLHLHDSGQCFPLYWYESAEAVSKGSNVRLFDERIGHNVGGYVRRDAITDWALERFITQYSDGLITKEDVFYYIYGVLHSPSYRVKYASSLKKMLPQIPFVVQFWEYSRTGRELAYWHLNYETVEPYELAEESKGLALDSKVLYRVDKMMFAKTKKAVDKTAIIVNSRVHVHGIPVEAYEFIVNGKSAIQWLMERYAISVDKDSRIKNDPNDWSSDHRYIIDLLKRIVRVSVETVKLVGSLPEFVVVGPHLDGNVLVHQ